MLLETSPLSECLEMLKCQTIPWSYRKSCLRTDLHHFHIYPCSWTWHASHKAMFGRFCFMITIATLIKVWSLDIFFTLILCFRSFILTQLTTVSNKACLTITNKPMRKRNTGPLRQSSWMTPNPSFFSLAFVSSLTNTKITYHHKLTS